MRLIYLGVLLVLAGAVLILLATYVIGSRNVQHIGTVTSLLGFLIYGVGRVRYHKTKRSPHRSH